MHLSISVNFEILFKSSPYTLCKALSNPKNSRISRSIFCDASRVLTWITSTKDESSPSGIFYISKSVGNSVLSLVAALNDLSSGGAVLSIPKKLFIVFTAPNLSLKVFCGKNSTVYFVKGTHLSPLQNSKIVAPFLGSVVSLNQFKSIKSISLSHSSVCTMRWVYLALLFVLSVGLMLLL